MEITAGLDQFLLQFRERQTRHGKHGVGRCGVGRAGSPEEPVTFYRSNRISKASKTKGAVLNVTCAAMGVRRFPEC